VAVAVRVIGPLIVAVHVNVNVNTTRGREQGPGLPAVRALVFVGQTITGGIGTIEGRS